MTVAEKGKLANIFTSARFQQRGKYKKFNSFVFWVITQRKAVWNYLSVTSLKDQAVQKMFVSLEHDFRPYERCLGEDVTSSNAVWTVMYADHADDANDVLEMAYLGPPYLVTWLTTFCTHTVTHHSHHVTLFCTF